MIKSAIFETNVMNMSPRSILLCVSLLLVGLTSSAQYTEKINSNRPGSSQGAYAVGNNVLQLESGITFGKRKHDLLDTKTNSFAIDYAIRYGLLFERLEIRGRGRFRTDAVTLTIGANEEKLNQTNFEFNAIGAKYLVYDRYRKGRQLDSTDLEALKSWRLTHKFKWSTLIPSVSVYAGATYDAPDNPFITPGHEGFSPSVAIATQNNWYSRISGDWVLVTNLIFDRIASNDMIIGWIITSTHTFNDNWAIFGEYQGQKSDFYSDNIIRVGSAYLFNKDFQIDGNIAFNYKDTPSVFNISVGASYRFDFHKKDELIMPKGLKGGIQSDLIDIKDDDDDEDEDDWNLDEFEETESDSLKQDRTPFVRDFEDGSVRDAIEKDLDERRTAERLERERIEAEKLATKQGKKRAKEERRKQKRAEKEARAKEKARLKAEKDKQKMMDDIDAELDRMDQDDDLDNELQQLEDELKKLEQEENPPAPPPAAQEVEQTTQFSDDELKMQEKTLEKERKEEEKRRKKAEKRRQKEEKKRKKQEEKEASEEDTDN